MSDWQLLREYVDRKSEGAFAALVDKHLKFVYWTCRRDTHDDGLAEDATQAVFLLLAQKAGSIGRDVSVSGWLFNAARLISRNAIRRQARRAKYEQEAVRHMAHATVESEEWMGIEPWLNDALDSLNTRDRTAILLRYFSDMSLREAAEEVGVSEKTISKRVHYALEKMRRYLKRKAINTTAAGLAAAFAAQSARSMPAHVDAALQAIHQAAPTAIVASANTLHQGVTLAMQVAKYKTLAAGVAAVSLLVTGVAIPLAHLRARPSVTAGAVNPGFVLQPAQKAIVINADGTDASNAAWVKSLERLEEATAHLTFTWDVTQRATVGSVPQSEVEKDVALERKDAIEQARVKGITDPKAVKAFVEIMVAGARDRGVTTGNTATGACTFVRDGGRTVVRDDLHITQLTPASAGREAHYMYCEGNLILTATTSGVFRFATAPSVDAPGIPQGTVWYSVGDSVRHEMNAPDRYLNHFPEELSLLAGLDPLRVREASWRVVSKDASSIVVDSTSKGQREVRLMLDRLHDHRPSRITLYLGSNHREPVTYRVKGYTKHKGVWLCSEISRYSTTDYPSGNSTVSAEWVLQSVTDTAKPEVLTLPEFTTMEDLRLLGPIIDYSASYNPSRANDPRITVYLWRAKLPTEDVLPRLLRGPNLSAAALRAQTY